MAKDPDTPLISDVFGENGVTQLDAVIAYLTYVIRYVKGWLMLHHPKLFRRRQPIWFVNLGLAAAYYNDKVLFQIYRKAVATALMLADSGDAVNAEAIRIFQVHEAVARAAKSDAAAEKLGIAVIPETAATATGFAKTADSATGLYLMVDVGAMTLDVCTFRLNKNEESPDQYPLLTVDVRPLGVEAFYWFLAKNQTEEEFLEQCRRCLWHVIWKTKLDRDPSASCWKPGNELPLFLTGGGSSNKQHKSVIDELTPWLRKHAGNEGIRLLDLKIPTGITLPEQLSDLGRLAVAFGLSHLPPEIGKIYPPSTTDDIRQDYAKDYGERFVSKDQV